MRVRDSLAAAMRAKVARRTVAVEKCVAENAARETA
jgi:hypothetical protein